MNISRKLGFKVGTLPWLMMHELRISWRQTIAKQSTIVWWIILALFALILAAPLIALPWVLQIILDRQGITLTPETLPQTAHWLAVGCWFGLFLFSLLTIVSESFQSLFSRGDLDLLLASPISPKVVLASRLLDPALQFFATYGLLIGVPISLIGFSLGLPQLLGIFPALLGLSLGAACLAVLLTLWLVRRLGVKRTRTLIKVLITLLGGGFYLSIQLHNLRSGGIAEVGPQISNRGAFWQPWLSVDSFLGVHSLIWFPVKAIFFDIPSVSLTLLSSAGLTWLTVELMHRDFLSGTQQGFTTKTQAQPDQKPFAFAGDLGWVVFRKEWRTMLRNPELLTALSLQVFYLLPAMFIFHRWQIGSIGTVIAVAAPLIGAGLVTPLVNVAVMAEETPTLLRSAPIHLTYLLRLKLLAALLPIWLLSIPVFVWLMTRREAWMVPLVIFLAATICDAVLAVWTVLPTPANKVFERLEEKKQRSWIIALLLGLQSYLWPLLGYVASQGEWVWSLLCLAGIGIIVALAYWRSRQLGTTYGF